MDQLARLVHGAEVVGQPGHRRQSGEFLDGAIVPGGTVGSAERIGAAKVPVRYGDLGADPVETLAGATDRGPSPTEVLAASSLPCAPASDDEAAPG